MHCYSVMWKVFVLGEGERAKPKLKTEVRSGLTEAAKDALVHELQVNGLMPSVGRYEVKGH